MALASLHNEEAFEVFVEESRSLKFQSRLSQMDFLRGAINA
jgi:hypothetical protein